MKTKKERCNSFITNVGHKMLKQTSRGSGTRGKDKRTATNDPPVDVIYRGEKEINVPPRDGEKF